MRENLRDYLKPKRSRRDDQVEPVIIPDNCQLSMCRCGNRGKPDIVVRMKDGTILGYACQMGYYERLEKFGLTQHQVAARNQELVEENDRKKSQRDPSSHSEK